MKGWGHTPPCLPMDPALPPCNTHTHFIWLQWSNRVRLIQDLFCVCLLTSLGWYLSSSPIMPLYRWRASSRSVGMCIYTIVLWHWISPKGQRSWSCDKDTFQWGNLARVYRQSAWELAMNAASIWPSGNWKSVSEWSNQLVLKKYENGMEWLFTSIVHWLPIGDCSFAFIIIYPPLYPKQPNRQSLLKQKSF